MSERTLLIVAACALIDPDGRILITQRPTGKSHAGQWEFPGGKLEAGETPEQAVTRELREELSVEPCERCLQPFSFASHAYDDFDLLMPFYLCRQWDGFARGLEGQMLKWVFPDKMGDIDWVPADIPLAQDIRDRLKSGRRFAE